MTWLRCQFRFKGPALFLSAALAAAVIAQAAPTPPNETLNQIGFDQKLDSAVPLDARFKDEQGRDIQLGDYFGKTPVILAQVYYDCPMLCTLTLNGLLRALRALSMDAGKEFHVVVVSFNPREGPELAKAKKETYLRGYGRRNADSGWHFLTGKTASIDRLTKSTGFRYVPDPKTGQFAHAAGLIVLTPAGRISKYFYGAEYSAKDLRLALIDASAGTIGSAVDRILLYCYHYDPATGRYGVAIMRVVRLAGTATVFLIGFSILAMRKKERARRRGERRD